MSNVTLDNATRQHLRQLVDEERRRRIGLSRSTPAELKREKQRERKRRWRSQDPEYQREYQRNWRRARREERERLGLVVGPAKVDGVWRCKRGHWIEGANVAPNSNGKKRCRTCLNEYQRERKRRLREQKKGRL